MTASYSDSLSFGHRLINAVMRTVYFGRIRVIRLGAGIPTGPDDPATPDAIARPDDPATPGAATGPAESPADPPRSAARAGGPRLIIASHRNGAIDGHQVLAAFPRAQFLVSIQLLRHWLLRLFIAGVPVVRPKDVERYGLDPASVGSPVEAGCGHLRRGGDLGVFPEASSAWGHRPQPYKSGAARMACTLIEEGIEPTVIPVGLFYSTPDRFRSRAEVVVGCPIALPDRDGRDRDEWESAVASAMGAGLDAVSVDCPDEETFAAVQAAALETARSGRTSFAEAFLDLQRALPARVPQRETRSYAPLRWVSVALMWLFAPVLGAAAFAGSRADGRNTVTFFRILGGFAATMVWVPALCVGVVFWPLVVGLGLLSAVLGWLLLGLRRIRL